jgi:hypothetical protein
MLSWLPFSTQWEPKLPYILEISLNRQNVSSIKLPTQCMTCPQRCFRQIILSCNLLGGNQENNFFVGYLMILDYRDHITWKVG